jgi:hypothetical protein
LIVFHEFFTIVDNHLAIVEKKDSQLAVRLKVKLANLPLRDDVDPITQLPVPIDRKVKFPNVHLSERNQVTILVSHFQSEEDKNLATFIANLPSQAKFSDKDIKKLTRMAVKGTSHLSNANMLQLQNALKNKLGSHAPINWDDFNKVQNAIMSYNHGAFFGYFGDSAQVVALHQASKAKKYFERQLGLPEDQIQIPRWYHATKHNQGGCNYLSDIIKAGQINVEHRQAFKGAWVSTQREWEFGNSVFVFNHRIAKLDPNVFIGYEKGKVRWRGLQYAIPLLDASKVSYLSLIGLYQGADKMVKADVKQKLENKNIKNLTIVSVELVDYIQREIIKTIGNPNLSEKWWGKADFSYLEKPLT